MWRVRSEAWEVTAWGDGGPSRPGSTHLFAGNSYLQPMALLDLGEGEDLDLYLRKLTKAEAGWERRDCTCPDNIVQRDPALAWFAKESSWGT